MRKEDVNHVKRYVLVALIVFSTVFWCTNIRAKSANERAERYSEGQYQQFEKTYMEQIKNTLNEYGYVNSGVTMTRMSLDNGTRCYFVEVYNRLLDGKEERQEVLRSAISEIGFDDEECEFQVTFLSYQ